MASSILSAPSRPRAASSDMARSIPLPIWAVLFSSTSVVIGVLWDISWHSTIGRDTFWSPPHMAIYAGGLVAGLVCGLQVLRVTFAGTAAEREASVTWWGYFRGPLGAWTCIWGAIAMLTSAPFDDWWHNAYGLDVKILSPPHAVLALGILGIQLGAVLMVLALQNRQTPENEEGRASRLFPWMYAYTAGLVVINFSVMVSEYTWRVYQHSGVFFQIVSGVLILPLVAAGIGGRLRWPATSAAAVYMGILLLLVWIFPLFPAEPKLAPIRSDISQMMPTQYPLLLIVPAVAIDLILRRWRSTGRSWMLAGALGAAFLFTFVVVQWPFASFLNSEYAHNVFFAQHIRPYMIPAESFFARGEFISPDRGVALVSGLGIALILGTISARGGLAAGRWMQRVRR